MPAKNHVKTFVYTTLVVCAMLMLVACKGLLTFPHTMRSCLLRQKSQWLLMSMAKKQETLMPEAK